MIEYERIDILERIDAFVGVLRYLNKACVLFLCKIFYWKNKTVLITSISMLLTEDKYKHHRNGLSTLILQKQKNHYNELSKNNMNDIKDT